MEGLSDRAPVPEEILLLATGPQQCGAVQLHDERLHITGDDGNWIIIGENETRTNVPGGHGLLLPSPEGPLWLSTDNGNLHDGQQTRFSFQMGIEQAVMLNGNIWALSNGRLTGRAAMDGRPLTAAPSFPNARAMSTDGHALWVLTATSRGDGLMHRWDPQGNTLPTNFPLRESAPSALTALQDGGVVVAGRELSRRSAQGDLLWKVFIDHPILKLIDDGRQLVALSTQRLSFHDLETGELLFHHPLQEACEATLSDGRLFIRDRGGVSEHSLEDGHLLQRQHTTQRPFRVVTDAKTQDRFILDRDGGAIYVWSPQQPLHALTDIRHPIALSRERGALVALELSGDVVVWDVITRAVRMRIPTHANTPAQIAHDRDHGVVVVTDDTGMVSVDLRGDILWRKQGISIASIAAGNQRIFALDQENNTLTAYHAYSGDVIEDILLPTPPNRGALRSRQLYFDPTTDRLFCGRDIFDGTTLTRLGHLDGIDHVVHADQAVIVGQRSGIDGTSSAVMLDPTALTLIQRTPLARVDTDRGMLSYDPIEQRLYLSEPGRGRVMSWPYPW